MNRQVKCVAIILVRVCGPRLVSSFLFAAVVLFASMASAVRARQAQTQWVGSWAASQQLVEPNNALDPEEFRDATLRQIVRLSLGGSDIRLRLSNRHGAAPLHITDVHIAQPAASGNGKIEPASDKAITFSGAADVTIPAHADYVSDSVAFPAKALSEVAITIHLDAPVSEQTGHPGSRTTSFFGHGNFVSASEIPNAKSVEHWYFIAGIEVNVPGDASSIVILGDSITDGRGSTTNANNRWTDILAQRLQAQSSTRKLAVLNHGIGGNRLLADGLGPNALARFDTDVIAQSGVRYLIVLEGVNDIGMLARSENVSAAEHEALVKRITGAYQQMIARAHAHGIKIIGATIMPFAGSEFYHPGPASEADRQSVNESIRGPGHFDAVIDFDKITRDPEHPEHLLPAFDSGDHLHPSPAGYAAMASAVPFSIFVPLAKR
jgi:lysophospholipase L1-like esterase